MAPPIFTHQFLDNAWFIQTFGIERTNRKRSEINSNVMDLR